MIYQCRQLWSLASRLILDIRYNIGARRADPQADTWSRSLWICGMIAIIILHMVHVKVFEGAVVHILEALYEPLFRNCSHGFRPGRGPITALRQVATGYRGGAA